VINRLEACLTMKKNRRDLSEQDIYIQGVVGFYEGAQEILACAYYYPSFVIGAVNNIY